jgi:hypothetical protein
MKRNVLVSSVLAVALGCLMVTGAAAQSSAAQDRSNKGGQDAGNVGEGRAAQVHALNQSKQKKDKDRNPDRDKNKGKHNGEIKGKAKGHRH